MLWVFDLERLELLVRPLDLYAFGQNHIGAARQQLDVYLRGELVERHLLISDHLHVRNTHQRAEGRYIAPEHHRIHIRLVVGQHFGLFPLCDVRHAHFVQLDILDDLGNRDAIFIRPREFILYLIFALIAPAVWTGVSVHFRAAFGAVLDSSGLVVVHVLQQDVIAPCNSTDAAVLVAEIADVLGHHVVYSGGIKPSCVRLFLAFGGYIHAVLLLDIVLSLGELDEKVVHFGYLIDARLRDELLGMQQGDTERPSGGVRPLLVVPLDQKQVPAVHRRCPLVLIVNALKGEPV